MSVGGRQRVRLRRWFIVYLVLLLASHAKQFIAATWFAQPGRTTRNVVLDLPPMRTSGEPGQGTIRVALRDLGPRDAPVVICLHGSPGSADDFNSFVTHLTDRYRVIAPDLPGFGQSSRYVPDYSIRTHARYVLAIMDALDIEQADVFGFSMGAGVAENMVDLAPQRVASMALYAGIGIQEGEGSGDYAFEHFKYALGFPVLGVLPEFIPHFGLLGRFSFRYAFLRNFWDTDQRPLRRILESTDCPTLILHGQRDFLVRSWVAHEHHALLRNSHLIMLNGSHFMLFTRDGSETLANDYLAFLDEVKAGNGVIEHRTTERSITSDAAQTDVLPGDLELDRHLGPWATMGVIITGTFVLEDATSVSVGLAIREGRLDFFVGVIGCFLGIVLGDIGLLLIGFLGGKHILAWEPVARRLPERQLDALGEWFDRHGWSAIVASRFIPGTRTPIYIAAGALGKRQWRFIFWILLAVTIWSPMVIILVMLFGQKVARPFQAIFGHNWFAVIAAVIAIIACLRIIVLTVTRKGRARLIAGFSRLWRWEFWPVSLVYAPLVPFVGYLAYKHGGLTLPTAANPSIEHGGLVGESKFDILRKLPPETIVPSTLIESGGVDARMEQLTAHMAEHDWSYPLILKPDVGERGEGLKFIRDAQGAREYLDNCKYPVLAQTFDPGPHEAGVFYYRIPGEKAGHIFSITEKKFPVIIGDGKHTVEELIWAHRRYRMQARVFLERHALEIDRVPDVDERVPLAVSGNHCQGTMFCEGSHLCSPELERAIDEIAQSIEEGFYIGRFDLRFRDVESFKQGRDFRIVELNGILSESSNIYDPSHSLFYAWRTLAKQWSLTFQIGALNAAAGQAVTPFGTLRRIVRKHKKRKHVDRLAD